MKVVLISQLFLIFSVVLASELNKEPRHDFLCLLSATSENRTKTCTCVLISPTNVIAAPSCAYFEKDKEHNITYNICYDPEKCLTEVDEVHCRTLDYVYKPEKGVASNVVAPDENHDFEVVDIQDIALFELTYEKQFELREETILPIVDPLAKVSYLQEMEGLVIGCNGSQVIDDLYAVQVQPGSDSEGAIIDEDVFYATSVNNTDNKELHQALLQTGSVFVVVGLHNDIYLMGLMGPIEETPHAFTFIPSCFEEATEEDVKAMPSVDLESGRIKRALGDRLKKSDNKFGNFKKKFQGAMLFGGFMDSMTKFFGELIPSLFKN